MNKKIRVVHYLNQFFAQIGGEDKADVGPQSKMVPSVPVALCNRRSESNGEVVATIFCGDNYFAEHQEASDRSISDPANRRIQTRSADRRPGVRERPLRHRLRRDLPGCATAARHRRGCGHGRRQRRREPVSKTVLYHQLRHDHRAHGADASAHGRARVETRSPRSDRQT